MLDSVWLPTVVDSCWMLYPVDSQVLPCIDCPQSGSPVPFFCLDASVVAVADRLVSKLGELVLKHYQVL